MSTNKLYLTYLAVNAEGLYFQLFLPSFAAVKQMTDLINSSTPAARIDDYESAFPMIEGTFNLIDFTTDKSVIEGLTTFRDWVSSLAAATGHEFKAPDIVVENPPRFWVNSVTICHTQITNCDFDKFELKNDDLIDIWFVRGVDGECHLYNPSSYDYDEEPTRLLSFVEYVQELDRRQSEFEQLKNFVANLVNR